jgi:hypothetical protein
VSTSIYRLSLPPSIKSFQKADMVLLWATSDLSLDRPHFRHTSSPSQRPNRHNVATRWRRQGTDGWMFTTLLTLLTEEVKSGDATANLRVGPIDASLVPSSASLSCAASMSLSRVRHSSVEAGHALPGRTKVPSGAGTLLLQPEACSVLHGRITTRKSRRVVPKAQPACPYR